MGDGVSTAVVDTDSPMNMQQRPNVTAKIGSSLASALLSWKCYDSERCGSPAEMSRPTVKEINYVDFKRILEQAAAAGTRVEKTDKTRWSAFVTQHGVKEAGFHAYARSHSESLKPVIIDDSSLSGGYYLYSERDEVCLKWIPRAE